MKLALIADTHFGYARFEEDAFRQAEYALRDAEKRADAIIVAGDIFDVKIPRLETLERAAALFSSIKKPVYLIHGNHERRSRDMVNPVQLLSMLSNVHYLHARTEAIGGNGKPGTENEQVLLTAMGSVPEELAKDALNKVVAQEKARLDGGKFRILLIHQSIKELVYGGPEELSLDDLRGLPFELIVNGHIHRRHSEMGGKLIIPGSTVITQLRNDEQGERGYVLYNTKEGKGEFAPVPSRLFFYNELKFENASLEEVKAGVDAWIKEMREKHPECVLKVKISGTLKDGLQGNDLSLSYPDGIYVQNGLNAQSISEKIKKMREKHEDKASVREVAVRRLCERLKGKVTMFEAAELFERLAESAEAAQSYIDGRN